jgi:hypothetical protein
MMGHNFLMDVTDYPGKDNVLIILANDVNVLQR